MSALVAQTVSFWGARVAVVTTGPVPVIARITPATPAAKRNGGIDRVEQLEQCRPTTSLETERRSMAKCYPFSTWVPTLLNGSTLASPTEISIVTGAAATRSTVGWSA
jgi:hypothetical protein